MDISGQVHTTSHFVVYVWLHACTTIYIETEIKIEIFFILKPKLLIVTWVIAKIKLGGK
jgi:hypothetical protein